MQSLSNGNNISVKDAQKSGGIVDVERTPCAVERSQVFGIYKGRVSVVGI